MNLKKKKKGFTLIELMAVIAIIAILAAVLVPTVSGYIERSKKTAIITQVRNVVTAIETHNATAVGSAAISDTSELRDIVADSTSKPENSGALESGFAVTKDIDRLAGMTVAVAKEINSDEQAIENIKVRSNGIIEEYTGDTNKVIYNATSGDQSTKPTS